MKTYILVPKTSSLSLSPFILCFFLNLKRHGRQLQGCLDPVLSWLLMLFLSRESHVVFRVNSSQPPGLPQANSPRNPGQTPLSPRVLSSSQKKPRRRRRYLYNIKIRLFFPPQASYTHREEWNKEWMDKRTTSEELKTTLK